MLTGESFNTYPYFPTKPTRELVLSCCLRYIASTSYQLRGLSVI